jgi:phosphatidylglycerophosphate synthase
MPWLPPNDPRRSAAATLTVLGAALGVAALLVQGALALGVGYLLRAASVFAVIAMIAVRHVAGAHPFDRFGAANQITALRAALVALMAGLVGEPPVPSAATLVAILCLVATALDGVDGWLARRTRMASAFGARFDLEVDAALIQVVAVLVWQHGKAGVWIVGAGLLRYVFVAAGLVAPWMRGPLRPTLRAKAICIVQIATLVVAILPVVPPAASRVIAAVGLAALTWSFAVDTRWLWRHRSRDPVARTT